MCFMDLIQQALPEFLVGARNTIIYCVSAFPLALLLGLILALMIPPFVNDFIYMLKDSAIVSVIAGTELTSVLNTWVTHHGSNPIPLYALALVLYLLLSLPTSYAARYFERRARAAL